MGTPTQILRSKTLIPAELRTRQWDAAPAWIRERAFFMAGVDRAEVLDAFHQATQHISEGTWSVAEARKHLRGVLDRHEYTPTPGTEGTVKDLRQIHRLNVSLETNLLIAQGYSRWIRQQENLADFPAKRLVRVRKAETPRNWGSGDTQQQESSEPNARWEEALAMCPVQEGATGPKEMVALVNHPIWIALSRFGLPYPPYDFNSGMSDEPVDVDEAAELGILPPKKESEISNLKSQISDWEAMAEPQDRGLNETLQATPTVRSQALRTALAESMRGAAEWKDDALVFTDPNGTRAYSGPQLAYLWSREFPSQIPLFQKAAVRSWLEDPTAFFDKGHTDQWVDLFRAVERINPVPGTETAYPGGGIRDITAIADMLGVAPSSTLGEITFNAQTYGLHAIAVDPAKPIAIVAFRI